MESTQSSLKRAIAKTGSIQHIKTIPAKVRKIFKCAFDIAPAWHIQMQAAFQEHCDAAVSKTINFAARCNYKDVDKAYARV